MNIYTIVRKSSQATIEAAILDIKRRYKESGWTVVQIHPEGDGDAQADCA